MKTSQKDQGDDAQQGVVDELKHIKRLLVLLLMKGGATQMEIAKALDTTQGTVSKQFRFGDVTRLEIDVAANGEGER